MAEKEHLKRIRVFSARQRCGTVERSYGGNITGFCATLKIKGQAQITPGIWCWGGLCG